MSEISEKEYRDARRIVLHQSDKIEKLEKENQEMQEILLELEATTHNNKKLYEWYKKQKESNNE